MSDRVSKNATQRRGIPATWRRGVTFAATRGGGVGVSRRLSRRRRSRHQHPSPRSAPNRSLHRQIEMLSRTNHPQRSASFRGGLAPRRRSSDSESAHPGARSFATRAFGSGSHPAALVQAHCRAPTRRSDSGAVTGNRIFWSSMGPCNGSANEEWSGVRRSNGDRYRRERVGVLPFS